MDTSRDVEVPPHTGVPAEVVDAAAAGQVVYLNRSGKTIAAVVPPAVAIAWVAAIKALEDANDIRAARMALADPEPSIPMAEVPWV